MWGDLAKLIVAKGFKKLPKVQKIAQSGHTGRFACNSLLINNAGRKPAKNKFIIFLNALAGI